MSAQPAPAAELRRRRPRVRSTMLHTRPALDADAITNEDARRLAMVRAVAEMDDKNEETKR